jgi:acetoin utilization protein AcuB
VTTEDGTLDGFLTRAALAAADDASLSVSRVRAVARFAVSSEDTVEKAALLMLAHGLVVLPVVDDDRLVGVISQTEVLRALASSLGIGIEAARFTVRVRPGTDDVYRVLGVLRAHNAHLLSIVRDRPHGDRRDVILRVEGVADRDQVCREMEVALTTIDDA